MEDILASTLTEEHGAEARAAEAWLRDTRSARTLDYSRRLEAIEAAYAPLLLTAILALETEVGSAEGSTASQGPPSSISVQGTGGLSTDTEPSSRLG